MFSHTRAFVGIVKHSSKSLTIIFDCIKKRYILFF